jgi:hypothetical protein
VQVKRFTSITAAALVAAALAAPAAQAMPDTTIGNGTASSSVSSSPSPEPARVAGPTVVVEADKASSFDWGSAAIGAGIVAGVFLLAAAAMVTTGRHGRLRPTH